MFDPWSKALRTFPLCLLVLTLSQQFFFAKVDFPNNLHLLLMSVASTLFSLEPPSLILVVEIQGNQYGGKSISNCKYKIISVTGLLKKPETLPVSPVGSKASYIKQFGLQISMVLSIGPKRVRWRKVMKVVQKWKWKRWHFGVNQTNKKSFSTRLTKKGNWVLITPIKFGFSRLSESITL